MDCDVLLIGAGPAAIFSAYELVSKKPNLKVVMVETGRDIYKRHCPIDGEKIKNCISCDVCSIMRGFGGAGAFSDGKYNFTTKFGGWLNEYISDEEVLALIDYIDKINISFGAPEEYFTTKNSKIAKSALSHGINLLEAKVRHLGTENNYKILTEIYEYLKDKVTFKFNTSVEEIVVKDKNLAVKTKNELISAKYIIAAPGRAGAEWFSEQCKSIGINLLNNQVDVGVRVEVPAMVFEHITDEVYEAKLVYRTKQYGDLVRTFCMNPKGYVVNENTDGIITVNGHSYRDEALQSSNTNFALLVSNKFTEPFKEPHKYGKSIASFSNMLGGGVLVQRFGDLIKGRRSSEHRIEQSFVKPTLQATPGDLSLVLPKRHLDNIIEMIYALDKIAPGMANDDTLLYGVEVKFYSSRLELSTELETIVENLFAIGDGAGVTRGLSQASASGVYVARNILKRLEG